MAYRFKASDASMTDGVRRIAAAEFALIRQGLADKFLPVERKVHESRKGTKRLRALLRLVAPVFPDAQEEIAALRAAAARLSALRDKGALSETLARLALPPALADNLGVALASQRPISAAAQKRLLTEFARDIEAAAERATHWTLERNGWRALAPGLARSHHRLRKTMTGAERATGEDPIHEFRKRAKDHWYHTLLLRGAFPDVMDGYAAAGERLCEDLGHWRDLGLLAEAIRAVPAHELAKGPAHEVQAVISKSRKRALRQAFRTARKLAFETPEKQSSRLKVWWSASR
jgi:CHAD domain-containing protein